MRRCFLPLTALCLGTAMAVASSGGAGAATISPSTFTKTVCTAIATATESSKTTLSAFKDAVATYKASPSPTTAAAVRDTYTQAYQNLDQQVEALLAAIDQVGTPSRGASFVDAFK